MSKLVCYTMEKKWLASLPAALVYFILFLFIANRYHDKCGEIRDSHTITHCETLPGYSPLVWHTCNTTLTPTGREDGFLSIKRTSPVHVSSGVIHVISSLVILASWLRSASHSSCCCKDQSKDEDDKDETMPLLPSKQQISARSLYLIFVLGITSLVYESFVLLLINGKCGPDDDARAVQVFCLVAGAVEIVLQVCHLIFEARQFKFQSNKDSIGWIKYAYVYIGTSNCFRWVQAIVNMACLNDNANALVVSEGVWKHLRPFFRVSVVFFYILTGMSYFCLSKPKNHQANPARQGQRGKRESANEKYKMTTALACLSVLLIIGVLVLIIFTRSMQESLDLTCDSHGEHAEKLKAGENFNEKKSLPLLVAHVLAILTSLLLALLYRSGTDKNELWHHMTEDPETIVFYVFGIGSLVYYFGSVVLHSTAESHTTSEWELVSSLLGFFACSFQLIVVTVIKVGRMMTTALLSYRFRAVFCLVLFFIFVSQLVISVLQEEFDSHVHAWKFLHGALPLAVDFFLSGAVLMAEEVENLVSTEDRA